MFCFACLRLVYLMLPVSLDCPFCIAPSVFANVYQLNVKGHVFLLLYKFWDWQWYLIDKQNSLSHLLPVYPPTHLHLYPPYPFRTHFPLYLHGFGLHGFPENISYMHLLYNKTVLQTLVLNLPHHHLLIRISIVRLHTNISSASVSNVNIVCYSKLPPSKYRIRLWHFAPFFLISSPTYLICRLIKHVNINKKRKVWTFFHSFY